MVETSGPIISKVITSDWSTGNSTDGQYNKKRVDTTNKIETIDINELRALAEFMAHHTHEVDAGQAEDDGSDPYINENRRGFRTQNGWGYAGRIFFQWGIAVNTYSAGPHILNFPRAFMSECYVVVGSVAEVDGFSNKFDSQTEGFKAISNSQFQVFFDNGLDVAWIAIGV